jgi:hypothetical protein
VVDKVLASRHSDLILVSHAYIGGMYAEWWRVYAAALANKQVTWRSFDDWVASVEVNAEPFADIPVNREVKYDVPKPAVPLEKLQMLPEFQGKAN